MSGFDDAAKVLRRRAERAVADGGEFLLEHANRTVPIEESILTQSGQATASGLVSHVSYDTPYARRQHEDMDLRHDPGRRAKWLELTLNEQASRILNFLAQSMNRGGS